MRRFVVLVMLELLVMAALASNVAASPTPVSAGDQALLAEATAAFERGAALRESSPGQASALLDQAAAGYTTLLQRRENGHLRYNLGNVYALRGDRGRATLEYLRAQRLLGADRDLASNMAQLGEATSDGVSFGARIDRAALYWRGLIPPAVLWWVGVAAAASFWIALGLVALRPGMRAARWLALAGALAAFGAIGPLGYEHWRNGTSPEVVVLESVQGRKGPDDRAYEPSFGDPLSPGTRARLLERRAGWARLRLLDGRDTWTPLDAVEMLLPANFES